MSPLVASVPWNVLLILVAPGLFAVRLDDTQLVGLASVRITRWAGARPSTLAVLFLLALFLMVGAVRETGLFTQAAQWLSRVDLPPRGQLVLFLVVAAVFTGLFSAGPSMSALLEVVEVLPLQRPGEALYVGQALAVCAGSSLFLTTATSGLLTQALVERAGLRDPRAERVQCGFAAFLPVGLLGFSVILDVAIVRTLRVLP